MRAVNLIPADARTGGGAGAAGRSGGAVYALLGGLALLVAMAGLWATTSGKIADDRAELARVQQEVAQARARAAELESPGAVQQTRLLRTETVRALATQRQDWAATLEDLSRTLPADTTLTGLNATSAGSASGPGAAPAATAPGAAPAGHTLVINGCAPSQRAVARLMPRLRTVPDVIAVQLVSSNLASDEGAAAEGTADAGGCAGATFVMSLTLEAAPAPVVGGAAPGATAAAAPGAPAAPGATVPASTATTAVPGTPTSTGGTK